MIRILVDSPDPKTVEFLRKQLSDARFKIISTNKSQQFLELARQEQPHIVVIDKIHERQETVLQQIISLNESRPEIRIIAISEQSSPNDAPVIEQGLFYYLTLPVGAELIRIIEAAVTEFMHEYYKSPWRIGGEL